MSGVFWPAFAAVSISCGAVGQVLLKLGVARTGFDVGKLSSPTALVHVLFDGYVLAGLVLFFVSLVLWLAVLGGKQLSSIYPFVSLAYVAVTVLSVRIFGDTLTPLKFCGIAIIVLGVSMLAMQTDAVRS